MIKKSIKKIFNLLGYHISKKNDFQNIDEILSKIMNKNPLIMDVGANKGQSIKRFKDLFDNPIIHSFEPIQEEFEKIRDKHNFDKNIFLGP